MVTDAELWAGVKAGLTFAFSVLAYFLYKPPKSLDDERQHIEQLFDRNAQGWRIHDEAGLRGLAQHHLIVLLSLFYRDLEILRAVALFVAVVVMGVFLATVGLFRGLLQEESLQTSLAVLFAAAAGLSAAGLFCFCLASVLSKRDNRGFPAPRAEPFTLDVQ